MGGVKVQGFYRCRALVPGFLLLLAGCASTGPAPVRDLGVGNDQQRGSSVETQHQTEAMRTGHYRVVRGDTLYSIAFRNGLDYRELAAWNGIGEPYTIYVGQDLRLRAGVSQREVTSTTVRSSVPPPPPSASAATPTPFQPVAPVQPSNETRPGADIASTMAGATTTAPPPLPPVTVPTTSPPTTPPPASSSPVPARTASGALVWLWPAEGKLVGTFAAGDQTRQGIDIAGNAGDPVRAAAAGTVVYSGNGLLGYGELVIIKHDATFLSAYGHNRKRLVKEGQHVAAGGVIAEMGASSASRNELHFEIRRKGKPVDPLEYLPHH